MPKRKRKSTNHNSKILIYIAWALGLIALILSVLVISYYFGYESAKEDIEKKSLQEKQKIAPKREEVSKKSDANSTTSVNSRLIQVLKKDVNISGGITKDESNTTINEEMNLTKIDNEKIFKEELVQERLVVAKVKKESFKMGTEVGGAAHEYGDEPQEQLLHTQREIKKTGAKPKLAIIIDDVSTQAHVSAINSVGLPLTKSFLPPSDGRPNSARLAAKESQYMVHLPMEAQKFSAEEPFTLRINDSQQNISSRIKELKSLFPKVRYVNNHTGSKFTADATAMKKLVTALNEQKIAFVDSRTTGKSEAPRVVKAFGLPYQARDVFLDHEMDKPYIVSQIKKAVAIAKKYGTAIAIGHPHANTIEALSTSKNLFSDVELVSIENLN